MLSDVAGFFFPFAIGTHCKVLADLNGDVLKRWIGRGRVEQ